VTNASRPSTGRKYVPEPEGLNLAFHRASARGALHLQQCEECGHFRHPPRHFCPQCASPRWSWTPVSGRGRVYSWVVTHFTVDRGWVDDVPYTTVAVELDEGPRVLGALRRDRDGVALSIGMDVTVSGEATGDDFVFLWVDPSP
jgi:hypothetical protein